MVGTRRAHGQEVGPAPQGKGGCRSRGAPAHGEHFTSRGGGQPGLDLGNGNQTLLLLQAAVELKANVSDAGQPRSPTAWTLPASPAALHARDVRCSLTSNVSPLSVT